MLWTFDCSDPTPCCTRGACSHARTYARTNSGAIARTIACRARALPRDGAAYGLDRIAMRIIMVTPPQRAKHLAPCLLALGRCRSHPAERVKTKNCRIAGRRRGGRRQRQWTRRWVARDGEHGGSAGHCDGDGDGAGEVVGDGDCDPKQNTRKPACKRSPARVIASMRARSCPPHWPQILRESTPSPTSSTRHARHRQCVREC